MARLNIDNESVKKYIYSMSEKLMRHFDLEYQINKENEYFDLYAFHQNNFFKSFITRSTVMKAILFLSMFWFVILKNARTKNCKSSRICLLD